MDEKVKNLILKTAGYKEIVSVETIQKLWNDYGDLLRLKFDDGHSLILKHIVIPSDDSHPKGFGSDFSRQRKIRSYEVETLWYQNFNEISLQDSNSRTPKLVKAFAENGEYFLLLEDLDQLDYEKRITEPNFKEVKLVLKWLAHFHAKFLNVEPEGLWPTGTYWHLETRPQELERMEEGSLKSLAPLMDQKLKQTPYQTIVHGDAKLANFCFSNNLDDVAAVDFQYVGGGCGMKDVAYFIGSCFDEKQSEKHENEVLGFYFSELKTALEGQESFQGQRRLPKGFNFSELEKDWHSLYSVAWADFHRFLKGWSPEHWKLNSYSEKLSRRVCREISEELLEKARKAALQAGEIIIAHWKKENLQVESKGGNTKSSDIVTEVDRLAQARILEILRSTIEDYDLGVLTEEQVDDQSRFSKSHFWCIDPLDGTIFFSEGKPGFSISIALVDKNGEVFLGLVYDPVKQIFYQAIKDEGVFTLNVESSEILKNSKANFRASELENPQMLSERIPLFADLSLQSDSNFETLKNVFDVKFSSGAVLNSINSVLHDGCYFKFPKKKVGGGAIWDFAAVSLIVKEAGGSITAFNGAPLNFNKSNTPYFHKEGIMVLGDRENYQLRDRIDALK